jgi:flavin-dependent dehydrogenase
MNNQAPMSLAQASEKTWDVIVVGAGPAGAMAAFELARRSLRVLLVDKNMFPRAKVCGCCLNGQVLELLRKHGLESAVTRLGPVPLRHLLLASGGHRVDLPLPSGVALSREAFDMSLINAAVESGVTFLPNTTATLGNVTSMSRQVMLRSNGHDVEAIAAVVLAADGLAGNFFTHHSCSMRSTNDSIPIVAKESRIGAAVIVERGPKFYQPETIYMACGVGGYVGLVRLEDGRLNIAAAFDITVLRAAGNPGKLAAMILRDAGLPPAPEILQLSWTGTPRLTRRARCLAAERLFVLGDAASFVEPFTGEGIAWALRSAMAVAPLAARAVLVWEPGPEKQWTDTFHREVERRQMLCRMAAALLRRPRLTTLVVRSLALFPSVSGPFLRHLNGRYILNTGTAS